jgi:hypothetical protein
MVHGVGGLSDIGLKRSTSGKASVTFPSEHEQKPKAIDSPAVPARPLHSRLAVSAHRTGEEVEPRAVRIGPTHRGRYDFLFSLRENAIAKEPELSYLARWRCVS